MSSDTSSTAPQISLSSKLKQRAEQLGFANKRSLGQNFLVNQSIVNRILQRLRELNPKHVIEIGPGLGALTDHLQQGSWDLLLLEMDSRLCEYWKNQRGINLIEGDALHWEWENWLKSSPRAIVSNLPYQIAASLIVDRCTDPQLVEGMILMMQKEVAQRIAAPAEDPERGFISVLVQLIWKISKVTDASPNDFSPRPRVSSRVLCFESKTQLNHSERQRLLKLAKSAFKHPRRKMSSNLEETQVFSSEEIAEIWSKLGFSMDLRAHQLKNSAWLDLLSFVKL